MAEDFTRQSSYRS